MLICGGLDGVELGDDVGLGVEEGLVVGCEGCVSGN